MGTVAGAGTLHGHHHAHCTACLDKGADILLPGRPVKVDDEKPAGFVFEQRVDAHHMVPSKVAEDDLVVDRREGLVRAITAFDLGKLTDSADELVRTGRRVAQLPSLLTHEPRGKDVFTAFEQRSKEPDLLGSSPGHLRGGSHRQDRSGRVIGRKAPQPCSQGLQSEAGALAFSVEIGQTSLFPGQLLKNLLFPRGHRRCKPLPTAPWPSRLEANGTSYREGSTAFRPQEAAGGIARTNST